MRRFYVLLRKELKELLTPQTIAPLLIAVVFFVFIGNVLGNEQKKSVGMRNIAILDLDGTATSQVVVDTLSQTNYSVDLYRNMPVDAAIAHTREKKGLSLLVIPQGFEATIKQGKPQQLDVYTLMKNFSLSASDGAKTIAAAVTSINSKMSDQFILQANPSANPEDIKNPLQRKDYVVVADKTASVSPDDVMGFISSQSMIVPIILFMVIVSSSSMIATAVAAEKENKTLETLLSTPIRRTSLVAAKMIAAGIVSLLMSVVYMFGFRYYMDGVTGPGMSSNPQMSDAISQLGLSLDPTSYLLLGLSLFFSILCGLSISIILGAFAEDVKAVQGLVAPIIFLVMIPYFLVMFLDLDTVAPALKLLVYAIPFSHPFLASTNLFLHNYSMVIYGIIYQAFFFVVFVLIAARIFSSDRILTMKLSFKKRKLSLSGTE